MICDTQEAENYCCNKCENLSSTVHTVFVEYLITRKAKKEIYKYGGRGVREEKTGSGLILAVGDAVVPRAGFFFGGLTSIYSQYQ
jgi:hypothetical protein